MIQNTFLKTNLAEDEMKTITIEIEDGKFEQFMTVMNSLKSDLIAKFQVQKEDEEFKIDEKHCLEVLDRVNREVSRGSFDLRVPDSVSASDYR
jgi:hypothetical protein